MPQRVMWLELAKHQLRAIDQQTALRILRALWHYTQTQEGKVKQLKGIYPVQHRLRVGDYRVRFCFLKEGIEVISVRHRREAYRDL